MLDGLSKMKVLLELWREISRHLLLEESIDPLAALIGRFLPIDYLLLRRIDMKRSSVTTVAVGKCRPGPALGKIRTECSSQDIDRIVAWCRRGNCERFAPTPRESELSGLIPMGLVGESIAVPTNGEDGSCGVVILVVMPPNRVEDEHLFEAQDLIDPMTAAFENDSRVRQLISMREATEADNRTLRSKLGHEGSAEIIGAESGLREVIGRAALVSSSDLPVLIMGETGSGKEVLARFVHNHSPRVQGPFLRVNCGAIPTELVDSELFGHERGSFTGAASLRKGWFERADGGTLFLDECGELPLAAQVRLLRILQDGTFERVGGEKQLTVNVRIVAATHRDLRSMVAEGTFREDLWYRLAVYPVYLPALRERQEDIPSMARAFAMQAAQRFGMPPLVPTDEDLHLLIHYPWPGNVRELKSVIERAAILGNGKRLAVAAALGGQPVAVTPVRSTSSDRNEAVPPVLEDPPSLNEANAAYIQRALAITKGRIEGPHGAAQLLKINPHTLRARMRKLGINWARYRPNGQVSLNGEGH
jgi:transcriptional regulator with GAF, ATPase, and Fis domain